MIGGKILDCPVWFDIWNPNSIPSLLLTSVLNGREINSILKI